MIDFNNLRFFYHAAKNQSFTLAAPELCVTQSAVTKRIKALEDELGLKLFERRSSKIFLTDAGRFLFEYAKTIFDNEGEIESALLEFRNIERGTLRIAMPKTFRPPFITFLMKSFREKYPKIMIQMNEGNSSEIINDLLNCKSEIGLIAMPEGNPGIEFIHFDRERLPLVVGREHPFTKLKSVSMDDIVGEPLILREKGSGMRRLVMKLFEQNHCMPNILYETSNMDFIKEVVIRSDGITFLLEADVLSELENGEMVEVPLKGRKLFLDVYISYLKDTTLSLTAKAYLNHIAEIGHLLPQIQNMIPDWWKNCPFIDKEEIGKR